MAFSVRGTRVFLVIIILNDYTVVTTSVVLT